MTSSNARLSALILGLFGCAACAGKVVTLGRTSGGSGGTSSGGSASGGSSGTSSGGSGGLGGSGVDSIAKEGPQRTSTQLDLLLVVDNSSSMADKQQVLADSASYIVSRLVNPLCVGEGGAYVSPQPAGPNDACPPGSTRELTPVTDMHIGVITSSLGDAGAGVCLPENTPPTDDKGQLLPSVRSGVPNWNGSGFLAWDPKRQDSPPGQSNVQSLISDLQTTIIAAGQSGCGFYVAPSDPFMQESIAPRSGKNPVTGASIQPPTSTTPNAINGHEYTIPDGSDLQYACIFQLPQSRDCSSPANAGDCDCSQSLQTWRNNPLCEAKETAPAGQTQYSAKAYPGLRQLEVAHDLGYKGVVASICPRNLTDPSRTDYGYDPAVQAMVERLTRVLR